MSDTNAEILTPPADAAPPAPAAEPSKPPAPVKAPSPASEPKPPAQEQHAQPTQPREPKSDSPDAVVEALRSLQRDNSGLEAKLVQAQKRAEAAERERDRYRDEVEGYARKGREDAIVSGIRAKLPHASELTIRGTLTALHEGKHVDRFSDKTDEAVTAALDAIAKHAPDLAKAPQPTRPGGPAGAPRQPGRRPHKSPF